jgi:hypothetical protein
MSVSNAFRQPLPLAALLGRMGIGPEPAAPSPWPVWRDSTGQSCQAARKRRQGHLGCKPLSWPFDDLVRSNKHGGVNV